MYKGDTIQMLSTLRNILTVVTSTIVKHSVQFNKLFLYAYRQYWIWPDHEVFVFPSDSNIAVT
jgi:hypothetical protein